jgi:hypothetical protein
VLVMAEAVVRCIVQALVGLKQRLLFGEQGHPFRFQFGIGHLALGFDAACCAHPVC